jgi:hypothetical protein
LAIRFSASIDQRLAPGSGSAYAEMLAGASEPISVRSIRITTLTALGGEVGLARSFAIGTGAASGLATGVAHRIGGYAPTSMPTSAARLQCAWSSSGVSPTGYGSLLRSVMLTAATGASYELWRDEDGPLAVEPSNSLLILNQASGAIPGLGLRLNFTWEKGPASDK